MKIRKIILASIVLVLAGCFAPAEKKKSSASEKKPEKTAEPSPSPSATPLSTDHTVLADKTLSIDYDLLENMPLSGAEAKDYISNSRYASDLNSTFYSPDPDEFQVTVQDQNYDWLKENYTFAGSTSDPYLNQSQGCITVSITGETDYENSEGYYADTTDAFRKNLSDAGYQLQGDHPGEADETGYQVSYYVYSKGKRTFSICEVLLNGQLSTSVLEVGNPA